MANQSKIEWTDTTWNPVSGCIKTTAGCKHCYAEREWARLSAPGQPYAGRRFSDIALHADRLPQPLSWTRPRRIFINSMSDLFLWEVPYEFIVDVLGVVAACWSLGKGHTFQLLTKRPVRMRLLLGGFTPHHALPHKVRDRARRIVEEKTGNKGAPIPWPLPNLHVGVSCEDQTTAEWRLRNLALTPAAVRFVSCEPLLGPIDLHLERCNDRKREDNALHWVIVGGESGHKARKMAPDWALNIEHQCRLAEIPFFFKQGSQTWGPAFKDPARWPNRLKAREFPQ